MPQQINLYSAELFPFAQYAKVRKLAANAASIMGGIFFAAYLGGMLLEQQNKALGKQVQTLTQQNEETSKDMRQLMSSSPADLQKMQQALDARIAMLATKKEEVIYLKQGTLQNEISVSSKIQLLTDKLPQTVWMTRMALSSNTISVDGSTYSPSAIDQWIEAVGKDKKLKKYELGDFKIALEVANKNKNGIWSFNLRNNNVSWGSP